MTKLRKLAGWLPAVGAMIFNGCVIGWLHCTKPQLLGSSVPGNVVAVGYTILFLLWWGLAPAAAACLFSGPLFPCLAMLLPAELLFALTVLRRLWTARPNWQSNWPPMSLPCWGCRTGQRSRSSRSTRTGWATTALLPGKSCFPGLCWKAGLPRRPWTPSPTRRFMCSRLMWWKTSTGTMPRPRRPTTTRPDDGCGTIRMGTSRARRTS